MFLQWFWKPIEIRFFRNPFYRGRIPKSIRAVHLIQKAPKPIKVVTLIPQTSKSIKEATRIQKASKPSGVVTLIQGALKSFRVATEIQEALRPIRVSRSEEFRIRLAPSNGQPLEFILTQLIDLGSFRVRVDGKLPGSSSQGAATCVCGVVLRQPLLAKL